MSSNESIIPALITGGFGAGIATVTVALIQTRSKRAEVRATAADLITEAASTLATRQAEHIIRLEARVERQAQALIHLTEVLDELIPQLRLEKGHREALHAAIVLARTSI